MTASCWWQTHQTANRYDLFDSSISYAHTRSIANGKQCHLILMLDKNANIGRQTVRHIARMPEEVQRWTQFVAVRKEGAYPPAEIVQETQVYHSDSEDDMQESAQYIKDPTMSGRIYPQDAVDVIYRYFSLSEPTSNLKLQPIFEYSSALPTSHRCTVTFPPAAPISTVQGPTSVSKVAARRAACFEACKRLHNLGLLSYKLFPRPREVARRLRPVAVSVDEDIEQTKGDILPTLPPAPAPPSLAPIMSEVHLPKSKVQGFSGTRCYKRKSPEFWKNAIEADRTRFYPTIVTVDRNHNPQKPYRPILIITAVPLPSIDDFQLFFATMPSVTYLRPAFPMVFDKDQLELLHRYTIRAMRGIFNKAFVCPMEEMPFLIAPLDFGWNIETGKADAKWPFPDVSDYIPWDLILYAAEQHLVPLRAESLESLEEDIKDAVVQDWWSEYTKRYDCMRVRADLNPLTPLESLAVRDVFGCLPAVELTFISASTNSVPWWISAKPNEKVSKGWLIMDNR
jgi:endoribonuclease Dicer